MIKKLFCHFSRELSGCDLWFYTMQPRKILSRLILRQVLYIEGVEFISNGHGQTFFSTANITVTRAQHLPSAYLLDLQLFRRFNSRFSPEKTEPWEEKPTCYIFDSPSRVAHVRFSIASVSGHYRVYIHMFCVCTSELGQGALSLSLSLSLARNVGAT